MSKAYKSSSARGWLGLLVAGVLFSLSPGWQSAGTGQGPATAVPPQSFGGTSSFDAGNAGPNPGQQAPAAGFPVNGNQPMMGQEAKLVGSAAAGDCIGFTRPAADGGQIITLINTTQQWMAVYHVDGSGQIHLTGSRPLNQDFAVQYNTVAPLPEELRRIAGG